MTLAVYNSAAFKAASGLALAPNATVEVRRESDSGLAALFSDEAGTAGITNPSAFADNEGRFSFYVVAGVGGYSVKVTSGAEVHTINNVAIGTSAQYDVDAFAQLPRDVPFDTANLTIVASVGSSALTIALKTTDGNDPSAASPVYIKFRNSTIANGAHETVKLTAAKSIVASSGSTLGTVSAQAHRLYVIAINDGGTVEMALWNPWDDTNKDLIGLVEDNLYSATAEGGAGAADSAHVLYAGSAVTTKAIRILGYIESTQSTAGTWATTPSKVSVMQAGMRRTGDVVQVKTKSDGAVANGSTTFDDDDNIPAITEGNEFITQAITPSSEINVLNIEVHANVEAANASASISGALFQDAISPALAAVRDLKSVTNPAPMMMTIAHLMLAGTTSSTTLRFRAGNAVAGTITFNGSASARKYGGVMASLMRITETFV